MKIKKKSLLKVMGREIASSKYKSHNLGMLLLKAEVLLR